MMFGAGCPILFPIAAFSLLVLYLIENYMLYYVYKNPPAYDQSLNQSVLVNLAKAPLFLLAFSFWMLSSHQLIGNSQLFPIDRKGDTVQTGHLCYEALLDFDKNPAFMLLILFIAYFIYLFFRSPVAWVIESCCGITFRSEMDLDEDIDLYQNCLDTDDQ